MIAEGQVSSRQLIDDCLKRIEEFEPSIHAWAHLDADYARDQADARDKQRRTGRPIGPLHGIPIGLKDIIDSTSLPCEFGSPIYAGRKPTRDSTVVSRLRQAGAVIMGKTVTAEFASYTPGATTNPHDSSRTPGGSSSGSAAAVAAHMVPGAIGTQTNASVIRPASFCGVVGFKPSFGVISRRGVMTFSGALDTVGVLARSLPDAALLTDALAGFDAGDEATAPPSAHPQMARIAAETPPAPPKLGFVKTPMWDQAQAQMQEAMGEIAEALGNRADWADLPQSFDNAVRWQSVIMEAEGARNFAREYGQNPDELGPEFRATLERGLSHSATDYIAALEARDGLNGILDEMFETYDALVMPASPGEAPVGLDTTGNPVFGTICSLVGTPSVSLPLLQGENGLPMGVQLFAKRGDDARLLRTAAWLNRQVTDEDGE